MKFKDFESQSKPIIYKSKASKAKGNILYFHGGGFIFGSNDDLPSYHIKKITNSGYNILSFNYPLAPEADFEIIIDYVVATINSYIKDMELPYFLWGRSAGAYISLLATSKNLITKASGIISYYGYGLLAKNWHSTPSDYYLKHPSIEYDSVKSMVQQEILLSASASPRFLFYLHTRQTGTWLKALSNISTEDFLGKFSLINTDFSRYPPVLLVHNTRDNDVPYEESLLLSRKIEKSRLITFTTEDHDFDEDTSSIDTLKLIKETIEFLDSNI